MNNIFLTIHRILVNMIRYSELPGLIAGVVRISESHNPETLKILSVFNLLKEHQTEVEKLRVEKRKHELTEEITRLRNEQERIFGALLSLMKGHKKAAPGDLSTAKATVMHVLDMYLLGILSKNNFTKMRLTNELLDAIDGSDAMQTALQQLGYSVLIEALSVNYNAIAAAQNERTASRSARSRVNKAEVKKKAAKLLTSLFNTIEINQEAESNIDYQPLINELNDFLLIYKQQMLLRYTVNRTARIKK